MNKPMLPDRIISTDEGLDLHYHQYNLKYAWGETKHGWEVFALRNGKPTRFALCHSSDDAKTVYNALSIK